MFGSVNTCVDTTYGQGCYVTTNGGLNWYGTDLMSNEPGSTSDPAPTIDKNGVIVFTSGVYFYRMQSEGFTDIKKMMLIK